MSSGDIKQMLTRLSRIGIELSEVQDLDDLFVRILEEARHFTKAQAGTLFIKEDEVLRFAVTQTSEGSTIVKKNETISEKLRGQRIPIDRSSIAGYVALTAETLNIPDVYKQDPKVPYKFNKAFDEEQSYTSKSMLIFPLKEKNGDVIGVLQLINAQGKSGRIVKFPNHLEDLVGALASQAAIALHNTQLTETLKEAYLDTIYRLAKASEFRDNETGNHVKRMSHYSSLLAEKMGFDEKFCELILYASPMHDIGKIAIPDQVLKKPGKLTKEEFEKMKKHAEYGAHILSGAKSKILRCSEVIARTHHEKWDGSGYPNGLAGEDIPIEGRIVAVADVFDALTSKRCYKDAFPVEKALAIMQEDRGRHFDPKVFDTLLRSIEDILMIRGMYEDTDEDIDAKLAA